MGTGELLNIPGNIKQMFLPFVLDPNGSLNDIPIDVAGASDPGSAGYYSQFYGSTQFFSFRSSEFVNGRAERGNFRVTPSSFYDPMRGCIDADMSYALTYSMSETTNKSSSSDKRNIATEIFQRLPYIRIREYQHDAKLDILLNLFQSFGSAWKDGVNAGERAAKQDQNMSWAERFSKTWDAVKQGKTGFGVVFNNLQRIIDDIFGGIGDDITDSQNDEYTRYVLRIPYLLYYRMMSATTQNIYELPYNGTVLYESNGGGYNTNRHLLNGLDGSESGILGTLRNFVGKNIKINTTPTWDGADGDSSSSIELEFTLFNDTTEAALRNFILVNTIVPNNMWMQYHVFQHAPCLYDVKIDGLRRFFMCSGQFTCEQVGQLRIPAYSFLDGLGKHVNTRFSDIWEKTKTQSSIRIPDMYKIRCTFTSLLPNNFNNYMFQYYFNESMQELHGTDMRTESVANEVAHNMGEELSRIYKYPNASQNVFSQSDGKKLREVPTEDLEAYEKELAKQEADRKKKEKELEDNLQFAMKEVQDMTHGIAPASSYKSMQEAFEKDQLRKKISEKVRNDYLNQIKQDYQK